MVILIGETEQIGKAIGNSSGVVAVFFINSRLITAGEKAKLFHFFRSDVQVPCQKIAENAVAGLFTVIFNGRGAFLFFLPALRVPYSGVLSAHLHPRAL